MHTNVQGVPCLYNQLWKVRENPTDAQYTINNKYHFVNFVDFYLVGFT